MFDSGSSSYASLIRHFQISINLLKYESIDIYCFMFSCSQIHTIIEVFARRGSAGRSNVGIKQ